ncbi:MAG: hypothetical protein KIT11_04765 [Fimbriimonadaceae bacterium]|nr:hypothetical protein [Fimbriimonadaceae bacterium]QYK56794.1 MAG: hypothetical protein KF733_04755 [Fimbriimonadaceae bacterium]
MADCVTALVQARRTVAAAALAFLATLQFGYTQEQQEVPGSQASIEAKRVERPPVIDGKLLDSEWPAEPTGRGFRDADTGEISNEDAVFWLTYDSNFVYFAAKAFTDPRKVIDEEYRANVSLSGNDSFFLDLDMFGTGQSADSFGVNAAGATAISLAGGRAAKTEWLGEFEAYGAKVSDGWQCEAKIPWRLITCPRTAVTTAKFNVRWFRTNKANTYQWRYVKGDFSRSASWLNVYLPRFVDSREIKLLPYAYAGLDEKTALIADAGLDAKTGIGDQIQLVGTINPDFRNVEQGVLSLDFSYFERLVAEARPFFQEGSQFRRTGFDQQLFTSQRIRKIDAGLNAYGKLDANTSFGALSVADFGKRAAHVVSVDRQLNGGDTIAATFVSNEDPGRRNRAYQLNYFDRLNDAVTLFINNQLTDDQVRKTGSRNATGFTYNADGWEGDFEYTQVTPEFFPRIGFSPERDFRGFSMGLTRETPLQHGPIQDHYFGASVLYYDHFDSRPYRRSANTYFGGSLRSRLRIDGEFSFSTFEGSADRLGAIFLSWPNGNRYRRWSLGYTNGMFGGEAYDSINAQIAYRPVRRLQLNVATQVVKFRGYGRQNILSFNYDIGRYEAVGGRLVNSGDDLNWYLSYRLSGRKGNEYFVVLGDPNSRTFTRQLVLKVVVPLSLKF